MGRSITLQTAENGDQFAAYLAEPTGGAEAVKGGVVLIHEIWGLVDHIVDVADRLAAQGYCVIAPDLMTTAGITPDIVEELQRLRSSADPGERARMQPLMREKMAPLQVPEYATWAVRALRVVVDRLSEQPGVGERLAVIGFCFGGSYAFALAAADDRIRAAVPFYGAPPESATLTGISCPVLAFYGDQDERLMEGLPEVREQMKAAGVDFTAEVYPGQQHAFFNDSNPQTYDEPTANDAWRQTLDLLARAL